jgi:hypothetical protein
MAYFCLISETLNHGTDRYAALEKVLTARSGLIIRIDGSLSRPSGTVRRGPVVTSCTLPPVRENLD